MKRNTTCQLTANGSPLLAKSQQPTAVFNIVKKQTTHMKKGLLRFIPLLLLSAISMLMVITTKAQVIYEGFEETVWPASVTTSSNGGNYTGSTIPVAAWNSVTAAASISTWYPNLSKSNTGSWLYSTGYLVTNNAANSKTYTVNSGTYAFHLGSSSKAYLITPIINGGVTQVTLYARTASTSGAFVIMAATNATITAAASAAVTATSTVASNWYTSSGYTVNSTAGYSQVTFNVPGVGTTNPVYLKIQETSSEITIDDIAITTNTQYYYNISGDDVSSVNSWGVNSDGSGTHPANFTNSGQVFLVNHSGTVGSSWTVSGAGSYVFIGDGTNAATLTASAVTSFANVLTVQPNAIFATAATTTTTGGATINGTFQLNSGGWATAGTWTYGASGTIIFNNISSYGVNSGDVFWPSSSGPVNVNILQGGVTLNSGANRTVTGTFQTASGVTLSSATLTLNGTAQINSGGYFANAPSYGSSSTLVYNSVTGYGIGTEWATGATSGAGVPNNVTLTSSSANFQAASSYRQCNGTLTIGSGSNLTLSSASGGD